MSGAHEGTAPNPAVSDSPDPSMEDILASIRRILNEEDAKPPDEPGTEQALVASGAEPPEPEVLELEHSMMVPAPDFIPHPEPERKPEPMAVAVPQAQMVAPAMAVPYPASSPLVAPEAAAAAALSVGALMRTLATERSTAVHRGGPTIEDLVRDEIRPLLKDWLDQHLPPMVERLVRAEIERVVSRMT